MPTYEVSHEYKTILLIGGDLHNIQVVIEKDQKIYEAVFYSPNNWEIKCYRESLVNSYEFVLQE